MAPADDADLAEALAEMERRTGLDRVLERSAAAAARRARRSCERCGQPIPAARRQAVPGVRRCVTCQTRAERTSSCPTG